MKTRHSLNLLVVLLICPGLAIVTFLLPAGCDVKSKGHFQSASQLKSAEDSEDGSYSYEGALRAAEEAKARIELDDKPWPDMFHLTLGWVDLEGDGQKSRFKVIGNWGTRQSEKFLTLVSPNKPDPIKLYLFWDSLCMYYPPGMEWSENADDPDYAKEREFLEKIKYAYGYISEDDILARVDDPNYAIHFWGKDNGRIQEGRIVIRKGCNGIHELPFGNCGVRP